MGTVAPNRRVSGGRLGATNVTTPVDQINRRETRGRPRSVRTRRSCRPRSSRSPPRATTPCHSGHSTPSSASATAPSVSGSVPERVYFAAVDLGFIIAAADSQHVDRRPSRIEPGDDVANLRATIRAYLGAAVVRPAWTAHEPGGALRQTGIGRNGGASGRCRSCGCFDCSPSIQRRAGNG